MANASGMLSRKGARGCSFAVNAGGWRFTGWRTVTVTAGSSTGRGRELERIREFSTRGMSGREILVTGRDGRLRGLRLRNALDDEITPLTRYEYDSDNQLSAEIDALSHPRRFYYQQRHMTSHVDRNGRGFHYQFNDEWRVVHARGDGGVWDYHFARHDLLNEVEITDSNGHVTSVSFDDNGLPVSEIDPTGGNTVFHYDDFWPHRRTH